MPLRARSSRLPPAPAPAEALPVDRGPSSSEAEAPALYRLVLIAATSLTIIVSAGVVLWCQGSISEDAERVSKARLLLQALSAAGMSHTPGLSVNMSRYGVPGLFVSQRVTVGTVMLSLPSTLIVGGQKELREIGAGVASLPLLLIRERDQPSTPLRQLYTETLPTRCPNNLAMRSEADLDVVESSLHLDKVELMREELARLRDAAPYSPDVGPARFARIATRCATLGSCC